MGSEKRIERAGPVVMNKQLLMDGYSSGMFFGFAGGVWHMATLKIKAIAYTVGRVG